MASPFLFNSDDPNSLNLLRPIKDSNELYQDEEMDDASMGMSMDFDFSDLDDIQFDPLNYLNDPRGLDNLGGIGQFHESSDSLEGLEALMEEIEGNTTSDWFCDIPDTLFDAVISNPTPMPEPVSPQPATVNFNDSQNNASNSSSDSPPAAAAIAATAAANPVSVGTENQGYRDFSQVPDEMVLATVCYRTLQGRPKEAFPAKLYRVLERSVADKYTSIISWLPHGRAFKLHDTRGFIERVMPRFFYQSKITSFQRQLNLYGFRKLTRGMDRGGYCHELFLRGRPQLCAAIVRLKAKPDYNPDNEPNLYAMHPMHPMAPLPVHVQMEQDLEEAATETHGHGCASIQPAPIMSQEAPIENTTHAHATDVTHTHLDTNAAERPVTNAPLAPRKIAPRINICLSASNQSASVSTNPNNKKPQKRGSPSLVQQLSRVSYLFPMALF